MPSGAPFLAIGLEHDFGVTAGAFEGADCRVVVMAAEEIILLRLHDHTDRLLVTDLVAFGDAIVAG